MSEGRFRRQAIATANLLLEAAERLDDSSIDRGSSGSTNRGRQAGGSSGSSRTPAVSQRERTGTVAVARWSW